MTEPKLKIEGDGKECLTCDKRGNCAIEFAGGERHFMEKKEMDAILSGYEVVMQRLIRHYERQADARTAMSEIILQYMKEGKTPETAFITEKEEGFKYFAFSLNEITDMEDLVQMAHDVVSTARARAEKAYGESKPSAGKAD